MAEGLGKKLLGEVEEVGFNEIFRSLRTHDVDAQPFGVEILDRWINIIAENRPPSKTLPAPPVLELTSIAPGGGKTHLLYHLTAKAVLPKHLKGNQACAIIIDTDNTFSIPRLAQQITHLIHQSTSTTSPLSEIDLASILTTALTQIHILRPQTLTSLTSTLASLPTYLFNASKHRSLDRRLAFIAVDTATAFYWQVRAEQEDISDSTSGLKQPHQPYAALHQTLRKVSQTLECPLILTTRYLGPVPTPQQHQHGEIRALRPSLPGPLAQMPMLRLIVQRTSVRKLPVGISVEEAKREADDRQRVVEQGKFECVVNEWGVDERTLQKMQNVGSWFEFRITEEGVMIDER